MTVAELNGQIRTLRVELSWRPKSSYAYKAAAKRLEVAEKLRELQLGREEVGEV